MPRSWRGGRWEAEGPPAPEARPEPEGSSKRPCGQSFTQCNAILSLFLIFLSLLQLLSLLFFITVTIIIVILITIQGLGFRVFSCRRWCPLRWCWQISEARRMGRAPLQNPKPEPFTLKP